MVINKNSSRDDLATYVRDVLGVDPEGKIKADLSKIIEAEGWPADPTPPSAEASVELGKQGKEGRVKILIPSVEDTSGLGTKDVTVMVNGVAYLIRRDSEAEVPVAVVEALKNAVQTKYRQNEDGSLTSVSTLRYPFQQVA